MAPHKFSGRSEEGEQNDASLELRRSQRSVAHADECAAFVETREVPFLPIAAIACDGQHRRAYHVSQGRDLSSDTLASIEPRRSPSACSELYLRRTTALEISRFNRSDPSCDGDYHFFGNADNFLAIGAAPSAP